MSAPRRSAAARSVILLGLVGTASLTAPAGPVTAGVASACPGTVGVTVVVDFGPYGGLETSCAPGDPATGLEALAGAGFRWEGTRQFAGFVCRIDGLPTPEDDQCVRTPPGDAYWSYWHAERGGSWAYGGSGASSSDPAPGTVDGWAFGAGDPPAAAPPAADPPPDPPPPPPPPPPPGTTEPGEPTDPGPSPPGSAGAEPSSAPASTSPAASAAAGTSLSGSASPSSSTPSRTAAAAEAAPGAAAGSGGGGDADETAAPAAVGLGVIGVLLAAAGIVVIRRRRTESA